MSHRIAHLFLAFLASLSPSLAVARDSEPRTVQDAVVWIDEAADATARTDARLSVFLEAAAAELDRIAPSDSPPWPIPDDGLIFEIPAEEAKIPGMHRVSDVTLKRGVFKMVVHLDLTIEGQRVNLVIDAWDNLPAYPGQSIVIELD